MSTSTASKLAALSGLAGAKRVVQRLASDFETSAAGVHAVLLYGIGGSGKNALADALAEAWLCTSPNEHGADGECKACGAVRRGNNPDLLEIAPQGLSSLIGQPAITAEKPDDDGPVPLLTFFRTQPLLSRHKVVVIRDAHRMNGAASNALLKTLEEPHPHAKLILTTDSVGSLLPTVRSRCLAVACELPSSTELRHLFGNATDDELRLAEQSPGQLKRVLDNQERYHRFMQFAIHLKARSAREALAASDEFREICESIDSATKCGARAANAEGLALLASTLARDPEADPQWSQFVAEAHRRIVGNGSANIVFDALFTRVLA